MKFLVSKEDGIGNGIMGTPFLTLLREHYGPDSIIDVLASDRNREVFEGHPAINGLFSPSSLAGIGDDYDVGFMLEFRSGGHNNIILKKAKKVLRHPKVDYKKKHEVVHCLELFELLGKKPRMDIPYSIHIPDEARVDAATLLKEVKRPFVVFHTGCLLHRVWARRYWLLCRWIELAERLSEEGYEIVLTGTEGERETAEAIADNVPVWSLIKKTSLKVCAAVLEQARAIVCIDCGMMHLAECVNTPVVALFGPTSEIKSGPWRGKFIVLRDNELECKRCYICNKPRFSACRDALCMKHIEVDHVLKAIKELI